MKALMRRMLHYSRFLPVYLFAGSLGTTVPILLYSHSSFFGWSAPRGGEIQTLVVFGVCVGFTFFLFRQSLRQILVPVSLLIGIIFGSLVPWVQNDPFWAKGAVQTPEQIWEIKRVAHGGGAYKGIAYTNSIEALDQNSPFFNYFELDFVATSDDHLVCMHGWNEGPLHVEIFGQVLANPVPLEQFNEIVSQSPLTACTMKSLGDWLSQNPRASVVTDVKEIGRNVFFLERLWASNPEIAKRLIPQAYSIEEISELHELGFEKVILTTYRMGVINPEKFVDDVERAKPFAVTMTSGQAGQISIELNQIGVPTYVFTVNDQKWFAELRRFGISNIYTDTLIDTIDGY